MPTYDFKCSDCGHVFEVFQKMNDKPLAKCPKCKKKKARRMIGAGIGIIFKGSGFYETDYKRKENKPSLKNGTSAADKSKTKDAASKEVKTEAKTDKVKTTDKNSPENK
ncbi:MAG: zinc ribbon domain-containing protein [Candidatus Omnitrophica bacterium]|nr:zinc ribbon domain-containing protein [Candidatus Omnitrophota bacterium]